MLQGRLTEVSVPRPPVLVEDSHGFTWSLHAHAGYWVYLKLIHSLFLTYPLPFDADNAVK